MSMTRIGQALGAAYVSIAIAIAIGTADPISTSACTICTKDRTEGLCDLGGGGDLCTKQKPFPDHLPPRKDEQYERVWPGFAPGEIETHDTKGEERKRNETKRHDTTRNRGYMGEAPCSPVEGEKGRTHRETPYIRRRTIASIDPETHTNSDHEPTETILKVYTTPQTKPDTPSKMRFTSPAAILVPLLVKEVLAAPFVQRRAVVTDEVLVSEVQTVYAEGNGVFETEAAVAFATTTIAGKAVTLSSTPVVAAAVTPVAEAARPATSAPLSEGGAFVELPKSSSKASVATPPAATTPVYVAPTSVAPVVTPTSKAQTTTLATSASAAAPSSSSTASSGIKKGVSYNTASLLSSFSSATISWAYNWGATSAGLSLPGVEYVPLLWGLSSTYTSSWSSDASAAIAAGSTHLMSFNEPDLSTQSNIGYADAAAGYLKYMQPFAGKAKLGAPAVTNGGAPMGLTYLGNFLNACSGCTIDFVSIHWYDSATNIDYFKSYVAQAYAAGGNRPLWITEFGASGSDAEVSTFLETVIPWLDSLNYVERYAYFMASDGILLSSGSTLSSIGETYASAT
ncbi:hypothetical protein B7494_g7881 [Chlorociboria aeruginascens]|nr:hypothetical protein B7494_g7881 [Chlorociboria aeruginascens]